MGVEAGIRASSQNPVQAETADDLQGFTIAVQIACSRVRGVPIVEDGDGKSQSWGIGHARIQTETGIQPSVW